MKNQNEKLFRWIFGGGLICLLLAIPEVLIAKLISKNNPETHDLCVIIMLLATFLIYLTISIIKVVKYQKKIKEDYENEIREKSQNELTTEFKEVLFNNSLSILKDSFKCRAKIGDDGKIVCKIKSYDLDCEVKYENYEEFLKHFHFAED